MNAAQLATESIEKYGEYTAFHFEGRSWSNLEHAAYSGRVAAVLRDAGVVPGDVVLVVMPNCPEVLACFQAAWKLGAVIAPITPQLSENEIAYVLGHSEAKVAIAAPETVARTVAAAGRIANPPRILVIGASPESSAPDISANIAGAAPIATVAERSGDDLAFLLYTSGTTGHPKGVMLTHDNIVTNHRAVASFGRLKERSSTLLVLPMSHSFGVLIMNLCHIFGATASVHRKFEPVEVLEAIERYKVTRFSAVPTMLVRLINCPDRTRFDLSSLEIVNSGASILPNEVRVEFERLYHCKVLDGYGLSECAPTACSYPASETIRPGAVGKPIPGVQVVIQNEAGEILPAGEVGEICIKGPNVMKGYLKDEAATLDALRGGWLHSGDVGYADADGYVYLTDRMKDLIIKGGENISPREIEEALYQHPAVAEAAVVGVPDATYGESIVAAVALKPGGTATEPEMIAHAAKFVTKFKLPSRVIFVESLPKNANGKIDRKVIRADVKKG